VTLVTVLSIVAVISVYAVLIGTFTGGEVTVGTVPLSYVKYSTVNADPGTWTSTLTPSGALVPWYSRLEIPPGGYSGPVTITWQLENKTGASTWANVTVASQITDMVLNGLVQYVYATTDGIWAEGNHNWGANVPTNGTYRVIAYVNSA
jgi:hypothetical protein